MTDRQRRFIKLLEEIFELNKSDLDFGIYRILNYKRKEITTFFKESLPRIIDRELKPFAGADKEALKTRMSEIEGMLGGKDSIERMQESIPIVAEYRSLKKSLATGLSQDALEADVYSALYSFFNRYYDEGDFISKRRYKEGVYAIPYEGEEVKLYWANQDQYYIKTSENFKDYTFVAEDVTVRFLLVDATTEHNNNKEKEDEKRVFMLFKEDEEKYPGVKTFSYDPEAKEFIVRFVYDIPQNKKRKYSEENANGIVDYIRLEQQHLIPVLLRNESGDPKNNEILILRHLKRYEAKNSFDYFIHKDLRGFLNRELDFYIKSEVLNLDDLEADNMERNNAYFAKIRAIKKVARTIIDFLARLENFQKRLWLKRKFVVETNWCITLDNIDESFYPEIAANDAQVEDWIKLFAIDKIPSPAFSRPVSVDFLKANKNLVLDTRHFPETFKDRLVASLDHLDERTNGVLINADNFHAIRLLERFYRGSLRTIYIDPPYNSPSSEIQYKNSYKHSSWLTLLCNRIEESRVLLDDKGAYVIAIDENEHINLTKMMGDLMGHYDIVSVAIEHNKKGIQGDHFSYTHEYAVFAVPYSRKSLNYKERPESKWEWSQFRNWGDESLRSDAANCFYPVYVKGDTILGCGSVCDDNFHPRENEICEGEIRILTGKDEWDTILCKGDVVAVYPIDSSGVERKWRYAMQSFLDVLPKLKVEGKKVKSIKIAKTSDQFKTLWSESIYNAGDYGTKLLTNMGFGKKEFKFPKSIYTTMDCVYAVSDNDSVILDYFAGSGTTAHAVLQLNRLDDRSHRKYVLTEMGEYFSTVTKPRVEKAVYADSWKSGEPVNRTSGVSQIVKYMRLESYEDALSNITLDRDNGMNFGDEYLINYMLDVESRDSLLNVDKFCEPFNFYMNITERNETKLRKVDPVETFNYLIGLKVCSKSAVRTFQSEPAKNPDYEGAVDLNADDRGKYVFQQLEGGLHDGRRVLVIWRNITDDILESNAALDAYFRRYRHNASDCDYDVIYVNGDNNLENLRRGDETWKVAMIEPEFNKRMWEE